jgi:hypothetical protein
MSKAVLPTGVPMSVPTSEQVLLERWLDHIWMEKGLGDHTLASYRSDLEQFALWLGQQGRALLQADRIAARLAQHADAAWSQRALGGAEDVGIAWFLPLGSARETVQRIRPCWWRGRRLADRCQNH